jgi:hypothetical protein
VSENWLKEYGFNPLRLPRRDLRPLDVLRKGHGGAFDTKVGTLDMLLSSGDQLPEAVAGEPAGGIAQKRSRKLEGKLGLSVLGALFGSKLGARTALGKADQLEVTYEDVLLDSVPLLVLQRWVEGAQITAPQSALVDLNDDRFAVVTAVLRSSNLSVSATHDGDKSLSLDVPEISGVVSAGVGVSSGRADGSSVTFAGEPIAFGFQAYVLMYEGNLTLGLQEVRGEAPENFSDDAWTGPDELDELGDDPLPV